MKKCLWETSLKVASLTVVTFLAVLIPACANDERSGQLFRRSDCIAGAQLLWDCADCRKNRVLNQVPGVFERYMDFPIAGVSVQNQEFIYVIFSEQCERRNELLHEVLVSASQNLKGFPPFQMIEEKINPGLQTIEMFGDSWADGERVD